MTSNDDDNNNNNNQNDGPLFYGAIPHLRASLYAFGLAASSPYDAHWAQCGLVAVSVQTGHFNNIKEEWRRLLDRLVTDRTDYKCCSSNNDNYNKSSSFSFMITQQEEEEQQQQQHDNNNSNNYLFCPHKARGHLLERFLTRICQSRQYADEDFLQHALGSLTEAIEWLVECWTKSTDDNGDGGGSDDDDDDKNGADDDRKERNEKLENKDSNDDSTKSESEQQQTSTAKTEKENDDAMEISESANKNKSPLVQEIVQTTSDPPCVLASLLFAAKPLFYFLLPIVNVDDQSGEESEESCRRDMLVSCCIQLIHHWDRNIAKEASELLILAFCYGPEDMVTDYAGAVFESTKIALDETLIPKTPSGNTESNKSTLTSISIEGMIASFAQKSENYANSMLSLLLSPGQQTKWGVKDGQSNDSKLSIAVFRLIAAIATSCPTAGVKHLDTLLTLINKNDNNAEAKTQLAVAALACRKACFFRQANSDSEKAIISFISTQRVFNGWERYLMARHALVTGNFEIAKTIYQQLSAFSTSESSFLWLSVLEKVAEAEATLSSKASHGIPVATEQLRSATSFLQSLSSFNESSADVSFVFQAKFLNLRLDFLDLLVTIRQLTREMRLTRAGPKKNTRPNVHLRASVTYFSVLATKYLSLYRQFGLFIDQQSRTSLRTLHALCRFVASAARSTFVETLPETSMEDFQKNAIQALTLPKGDAFHPLTILMKKLDAAVLKDMSSLVDAKIRAAAMLEIMDGLLRAPCPFPRDFTLTKSIPFASLKLSVDPELLEYTDEIDDEVEIFPGSSVSFCASGTIPSALLQRSKLPFYTVLLWHTITLRETYQEDETFSESKANQGNKGNASSFAFINPAPTATPLSSNGSFFMTVECQPIIDEGLYIIETRLGCRDIRCGEWEVPLKEFNHSISVRVTRSKN